VFVKVSEAQSISGEEKVFPVAGLMYFQMAERRDDYHSVPPPSSQVVRSTHLGIPCSELFKSTAESNNKSKTRKICVAFRSAFR
jgi:hypothetical protein